MAEVEPPVQYGSLKEYDDIAGRMHLTLQAMTLAVILTEGISDRAALKLIVDPMRIFAIGSKPLLLDTCQKLLRLGDHRFVAVFDRDFDPLPEGECFPCQPYEGGDLEAAILVRGVGADIVEQVVPAQKLAAAGGASAVFEEAVASVIPLSQLRSASREKGWCLPFDQVDVGRCVKTDRSIDCAKLVRTLRCERLNHEDAWAPSEEELMKAAAAHVNLRHFRGRDVLCVLEKYFRSTPLRHRKGLDPSRASLEVAVHVSAPGALATSDWGRALQELLGRLE